MHTAASIGDLIAQSTEITQSDVASIFTVSNVIMSGYSNAGFAVKVTGVTIDELGHARVEWSIAQGMAADHSDMSYILPEGLRVLRNQALIITDTTDVYVPLMNVVPNFAISMKASARNRSRGRVAVNCTDCN